MLATWRYPPPYDLYDATGDAAEYEPPDADGHGYWVVDAEDGSGVVAFVCLGPEGRVPGQDAEPGTLDIGMGVRPDAVSQGLAGRLAPLIAQVVASTWRPTAATYRRRCVQRPVAAPVRVRRPARTAALQRPRRTGVRRAGG